jgi:hypothetical protein
VSNVDDVVGNLSARLKDRTWRDIWRFSCSLTSDPGKLIEAVLAKEEISTDIRASLVASALAEGIDVDIDLARRSCDLIMNAVERLTKDLWSDESAPPGVHTDAVWRIAFKSSRAVRNTDTGHITSLRELMKHVYEIRNSIWVNALAEALKSSSYASVRYLSKGLAFEGTFSDVVVSSGPSAQVVFSVVRELPKVGETAAVRAK